MLEENQMILFKNRFVARLQNHYLIKLGKLRV